MIRLRDAGPGDLDAVTVLCEAMRAEITEPFPAVERERLAQTLELAAANPDVFLFVLAETGGKAIGMVTAVAGDYAFSSERRAVSDLLFVLPERRGGMVGKRLVERFTDWADALGAKTDIIGVSTGIEPKRTGRFLELMGFRAMGMMYRRDR